MPSPASGEHGRALAEVYQILRQIAADAAQTQSNAAGDEPAALRTTEVRDDAAVTRSST